MTNKEKYTYYAYCESTKHYAKSLTLTINTPVSEIMTSFFKHTYFQPFPSVFKHMLEEKLKYSADRAYITHPTQPQRTSHGAAHAYRVAAAAVIFFKLYEEYGSNQIKNDIVHLIEEMPGADINEKRTAFIKLLQIAAAFHDSGRLTDGAARSEWQKQGANDCYRFIRSLLKNSSVEHNQAKQIAKLFANAIHQKNQTFNMDKPLLQCFIQNADCIDIMRDKNSFSINRLDIWKDAIGERDTDDKKIINPQQCMNLQKDLINLCFEWRELIHFQGSLRSRASIKVNPIYKIDKQHFKEKKEKEITNAELNAHYDKTHAYEMAGFSYVEKDIVLNRFPTLKTYYETTNKTLCTLSIKNDIVVSDFLQPLDEIIDRYMTQWSSDITHVFNNDEKKGIDLLILSLINLKQELKIELRAKHFLKSQIIRDETIHLITQLIDYRKSERSTADIATINNAIKHYHQQLHPLFNHCKPWLIASTVFILIAVAIPVIALSLISVIAIFGFIASLTAAINTLTASIIAISTIATVSIASYSAKCAFFNEKNKGVQGGVRKIEKNIKDPDRCEAILLKSH